MQSSSTNHPASLPRRLAAAVYDLLLLAGILLARLNEFVRRPAVRIASGLLVLGFGIYGLIGLMRLLHWI